jgi:hypothetical protein
LESETHVQREVSPFSFATPDNEWIFITIDSFHILMDIVIVDSTCTNMVQQALMTITHVATMAIQENT